MPELLTRQDIEALRRYPTPTVCNAIEMLTGARRQGWFTRAGIRCFFPEHGVMVGYACTATSMTSQPPRQPRHFSRREYWEYVAAAPEPRVIVMQDLSSPPVGAFWGEVHSSIHRALGCEGVITNGYVRDLDEARPLGFRFFASDVCVSHAYAHLEDFRREVEVFGMIVNPGDLIHADQHGAVVIPHAVAYRIAEACETINREEGKILQLCNSPEFSLDALDPLVSPEY